MVLNPKYKKHANMYDENTFTSSSLKNAAQEWRMISKIRRKTNEPFRHITMNRTGPSKLFDFGFYKTVPSCSFLVHKPPILLVDHFRFWQLKVVDVYKNCSHVLTQLVVFICASVECSRCKTMEWCKCGPAPRQAMGCSVLDEGFLKPNGSVLALDRKTMYLKLPCLMVSGETLKWSDFTCVLVLALATEDKT